jgi:hypothetical protein
VLANRGSHKDPPPPAQLFARVNTVARIDPATNKVSTVIRVGHSPAVIAVGGHSVWVYNRGNSTISEIDATTNRVVGKPTVVGRPAGCCGPFTGPVLAADAYGAWYISGDLHAGTTVSDEPDPTVSGNAVVTKRRPQLTHLLGGTHRTLEYPLELTPTGVAVGERAVWVVGHAAHDYQVLRINPANRHVRRIHFATPIESIAVAFGYVYVVDSRHATLYQINARTSKPARKAVLGNAPASRPELLSEDGHAYGVEDVVVVAYTTAGGSVAWVGGLGLAFIGEIPCGCRPGSGDELTAFGSDWRDDWPTGTVDHERSFSDSGPSHPIAVTATPPVDGGPCLTSMAAGAGSVWLTVGPPDSSYYACRQ